MWLDGQINPLQLWDQFKVHLLLLLILKPPLSPKWLVSIVKTLVLGNKVSSGGNLRTPTPPCLWGVNALPGLFPTPLARPCL